MRPWFLVLWLRKRRRRKRLLAYLHRKRLARTVLADSYRKAWVRCLAKNVVMELHLGFRDDQAKVQKTSRVLEMLRCTSTVVQFFRTIGVKRPEQLALELRALGIHRIADFKSADWQLCRDKLRFHSGEQQLIEKGIRRLQEGSLLWHYHLPRSPCPSVSCSSSAPPWHSWALWVSRCPPYFGLSASSRVLLADRQTCRAVDLRKGSRLLSFDFQAKALKVAKVREVCPGLLQQLTRWLPGSSVEVIEICVRSHDMEHLSLRVAYGQVFWCMDGGTARWAAAGCNRHLRGGAVAQELREEQKLIRRDGMACVVTRIAGCAPSMLDVGAGLVHIDVSGSGAIFIDGFLALATET